MISVLGREREFSCLLKDLYVLPRKFKIQNGSKWHFPISISC